MNLDEAASMCEKIVKDLDDMFSKQEQIVDISIVPAERNELNKSPVFCEEGHYCIESWCIPALFKHVHSRIFKNLLESQADVQNLSRILLMIQPDIVTLWNIRRGFVLKELLNIRDELKFSELILHLKPKSASTFNYREWLLLRLSDIGLITDTDIDQELKLSLMCSEKYSRNYYSWSHRAWIFNTLLLNRSNISRVALIQADLQTTKTYLEQNISDYSCCNYRQILLKKLADSDEDYEKLLIDELDWISKLIQFSNTEALVLHQRAIKRMQG